MRQCLSFSHRGAAVCLFVAFLCGPLSAATVSKLNDDVLAPLRRPVAGKPILLTNVPLYAHGTSKITLEEFQVWAPGGKVIVHDGKSVQYLDPPPMRFFRGQVNGDQESFAYFSVDGTTGAIQGLVATRDTKFSVSGSRRRPIARDHSPDGDRGGSFDYFLSASDEGDEIPLTGQSWQCDVEKMPIIPNIGRKFLPETDASGHAIIALGISGTQSYAIALEVETDDELYANAGNSSSAVVTYVTNLTGAVSTIYNRDLHTNVVQQNVNVYTGGPGTDPWFATTAVPGMLEIGDYYHANHLSLQRSAVVMLSGKSVASGVAWAGTIGEGDQSAGPDYAGAYSWCGGIGNLFGVQGIVQPPDPNATANGTLYGMPGNGTAGVQQIYWPLEEYAHELGHNLAGHHTHCVAISALEAVSTNHPTQLFIDMCFTGEIDSPPASACATGAQYSSAPTEKGTIMSYCHNVFISTIPQSRFTFGQASEVSHHELDDYMLNASGPGPYGGSFNIVTAVGTFTMSTITASSSVAPSSTGNTASVTTSNGGTPTFSWTITGGTITSASNIASITYTAGASGSVVLRATAYKNGTNGFGFPTGGVGITDTKTVTITSALPPTNVVATAITPTSVAITWTASAGANRYHVYRTANNSTYSLVNAESTFGTSFTDTGAVVAIAANTAYFYKVRAVDGLSVESADSNKDLATTVIFANDPLVTGPSGTTVQALHVTQLRTAVTAVCTLASNPAPCSTSFTDPSLTLNVTQVKRLHVTELRAKLDAARTALGLSVPVEITDPTITQNTTLVKGAHLTELRNGVK